MLSEVVRLRYEMGLQHQLVGLGVDRLDYTKGIPERFKAIDLFLGKYPEYQGRFTFLQVGPVSRIHIGEYKLLNDELYHLMVEINQEYQVGHWKPIRLLKQSYPLGALLPLYGLADVCIVSSLADGMNLVAKEFVGARPDGEAVLLLSRFAGAASELEDALLMNPYDIEAFADALKEALEMSPMEKRRRFHGLRQATARHNIYDWAAGMISELAGLTSPGRTPSEEDIVISG